MRDERKRLRLSKAKKGLVEGLTKPVHNAAGELVTRALMGLEGSPRAGGSVLSVPYSSEDRIEPFCTSSSLMFDGKGS